MSDQRHRRLGRLYSRQSCVRFNPSESYVT